MPKTVILKTYNQSSIEQLAVCTVRLRHKDKDTEYKPFSVPGDKQALLGMSYIKLLNILKITCEVMGDPHERRKSNLQAIQTSNSLSCKTNKATQIKIDNADKNNGNVSMPYYIRCSISRAAYKISSQLLTNKIIMNSVMCIQE